MGDVSLFYEDHGEALKAYIGSEICGDFSIVAEGLSYQVHKQYLAAISPFFRHLVSSTYHSDTLIIADVRASVVQSLIQLLYCGEAQCLTSNHNELLSLISELEIQIETSEIRTGTDPRILKDDLQLNSLMHEEYYVLEGEEGEDTTATFKPWEDVQVQNETVEVVPEEIETEITQVLVMGNEVDGGCQPEGKKRKKTVEELYSEMRGPKKPPRFESLPCHSNPVPCKECDQVFTSYAGLQSHMLWHSNEKPFECSECGARFRQKTNLKTHMRVHTGAKNFVCAICEKSFKHNASLKDHMNLHTGENPYVCPVCGKGYKQAKMLRVHSCASDGGDSKKMPKECEICGYSASSAKAFNSHMKVHEHSMDLVCKYCDLSFDTLDELKRHATVHRKETRQCNYCDKYFDDPVALNKHLMMHTNSEM